MEQSLAERRIRAALMVIEEGICTTDVAIEKLACLKGILKSQNPEEEAIKFFNRLAQQS